MKENENEPQLIDPENTHITSLFYRMHKFQTVIELRTSRTFLIR